jgi:biopolymer transport protein ExbD
MAEKRRFLDVWIVDTNTVYQEVPFEVVADWLQQGRLLADDMTKPSGTKDWDRIGGMAELVPYLPREEPHRPDDQAEALEPLIDPGFNYSRRHIEEDEDVDMIPLIDVSLVLLIFFLMAAGGGIAASLIRTPGAEHGDMVPNPTAIRIDIGPDKDGDPLYSVGEGASPAAEDDRDLRSLQAVLDRVKAALNRREDKAEVIINLDKNLPAKLGRDLLLALRAEPFRSRVSANFYGVSEKE